MHIWNKIIIRRVQMPKKKKHFEKNLGVVGETILIRHSDNKKYMHNKN